MFYNEILIAFCHPSAFKLFCSIVHSASCQHPQIAHYVNDANCRELSSHPFFKDEEEWIAFWKLVEQLKGLKSLEVKVVVPPPKERKET